MNCAPTTCMSRAICVCFDAMHCMQCGFDPGCLIAVLIDIIDAFAESNTAHQFTPRPKRAGQGVILVHKGKFPGPIGLLASSFRSFGDLPQCLFTKEMWQLHNIVGWANLRIASFIERPDISMVLYSSANSSRIWCIYDVKTIVLAFSKCYSRVRLELPSRHVLI